jgi:hypothetical protein
MNKDDEAADGKVVAGAPTGAMSQIAYMHVPRQDAGYPQFYQPQVDMYGRPLV